MTSSTVRRAYTTTYVTRLRWLCTSVTSYSYVKNLQGDIVAILNSAGTVVVSYVYDAWGRPIATTGSMADTLGVLNPFRYRGYVFDEEVRLYYLRSRYYAPVQIRFVNADIIYTGYQYTYCKNSPVGRCDPDGYTSETVNELLTKFNEYLTSDAPEFVYCRSFGLVEGAYYASIAYLSKESANNLTDKYFGKGASQTDGNRANAFKHAIWNAIMTREMGYDVAKGIADSHELPFVNDPTLHYNIPNSEHCEMDFYNNEYGRQYALLLGKSEYSLEHMADIIYYYAMSEDAYYRLEDDGSVRSIEHARPRYYYQVKESMETH